MSRYRKQMTKELKKRGFTGDFQFYFWNNDGWYCDCEELNHTWLGQHVDHAIERIKKGMYDKYLD